MKLLGLTSSLFGTIIDKVIAKTPIYIFSDIVKNGYTDITSIENLYNLGYNTGKDFKYVKNEIKLLVFQKAGCWLQNWFTALTVEERRIACELFIVPYQLRTEFYNAEEQTILGDTINVKAIACRTIRLNKLTAEIYTRMSWPNVMELLGLKFFNNDGQYVTSIKELMEMYISGREGMYEDGEIGMFDFIDSRTVSVIFDNNGLREKTYSIIGFESCSLFADHLLNIAKYGNY
jgi:hypothetical protein